MIKELQIKNFQAHINSTLEFCDGVNVITGSSDSGKSSVIRAITWVKDNRPSGDSVRNWEMKDKDASTVKVLFSEKNTVTKVRLKSKSSYVVNDDSFEALRQDVPSEVSNTFNFNECNFQTQHDPYFLLKDSPGEVARKMNEIIGLDIIDVLFKRIDERVRESKRKINEYQSMIANHNATLLSLCHVDDKYKQLRKCENILDDYCTLNNDIISVEQLVNLINSVDEQILNIKVPSLIIPLINEVQTLCTTNKDLTSNLSFLQTLVTSLEKVHASITELEKNVVDESTIKQLETQIKANDLRKKSITELNYLVTNFNTLLLEIDSEQNKLNILIEKYEDLLKKAKICPICFSPITTTKIKELLEGCKQ